MTRLGAPGAEALGRVFDSPDVPCGGVTVCANAGTGPPRRFDGAGVDSRAGVADTEADGSASELAGFDAVTACVLSTVPGRVSAPQAADRTTSAVMIRAMKPRRM